MKKDVDPKLRALAVLAYFLWEEGQGERFVVFCDRYGVSVDDAIRALREGGEPGTAKALQKIAKAIG